MELSRFTIRQWQVPDEHSLVVHANDKEIWRNLRDAFPHPYTLKDAQEWIKIATAGRPITNFAIEVDGLAAGGIGLMLQHDVQRRSAEIGYWLGRNFWGQGIMTAVVQEFTGHAFVTFDLCRIYATVFEWNPASARVLEKAGYEYEGRLRKSVKKDGKTIDTFLYACIR